MKSLNTIHHSFYGLTTGFYPTALSVNLYGLCNELTPELHTKLLFLRFAARMYNLNRTLFRFPPPIADMRLYMCTNKRFVPCLLSTLHSIDCNNSSHLTQPGIAYIFYLVLSEKWFSSWQQVTITNQLRSLFVETNNSNRRHRTRKDRRVLSTTAHRPYQTYIRISPCRYQSSSFSYMLLSSHSCSPSPRMLTHSPTLSRISSHNIF